MEDFEKISELLQIMKDPYYFLKYVYLKGVHGKRKIIPYEMHRECFDHFDSKKLSVIKKSRQIGISSLLAAYCVHKLLYSNKRENILVITNTMGDASDFIKKCSSIIDSLPDWVFDSSDIRWRDSKFIRTDFAKISAISYPRIEEHRGALFSLIIYEEAAFMNDLKTAWNNTLLLRSPDATEIVSSTVNEPNSFFEEIWKYKNATQIRLPYDYCDFKHRDLKSIIFDQLSLKKEEIANQYKCKFMLKQIIQANYA